MEGGKRAGVYYYFFSVLEGGVSRNFRALSDAGCEVLGNVREWFHQHDVQLVDKGAYGRQKVLSRLFHSRDGPEELNELSLVYFCHDVLD